MLCKHILQAFCVQGSDSSEDGWADLQALMDSKRKHGSSQQYSELIVEEELVYFRMTGPRKMWTCSVEQEVRVGVAGGILKYGSSERIL